MKRWVLIAICLCLMAAAAVCNAEEDGLEKSMSLFHGEKNGIAFALPGFGERVMDVDREGYWKDSIQLAGSCVEDGAEYQLRAADISAWQKTYRSIHPDAEPRTVMAQTLYAYSSIILKSYDAKMTGIKAKTVGEDAMILTYDYTYPDTPGVQYRAKCVLKAGYACCLTMEACDHQQKVMDALHLAEGTAEWQPMSVLDIAGLEATFPREPVEYEQENTIIYAGFTDDWSYLSVQYIPARLVLPENETELWETMLRLGREKVIPAFGGKEVTDPRLYSLGNGYMLAFSSISAEHFGEYGQHWQCRLYVTDGGVWYVYAADTEDGSAFLSRLTMADAVVTEIAMPDEDTADPGAAGDDAAGLLTLDQFRARLEALLTARAFGVSYAPDSFFWSEAYFSDGHWVRTVYSQDFISVPFIIIYTDGPEAAAEVAEVRVLGVDSYATFADTAIVASCVTEALAGESVHGILRTRLINRRKGSAPEETYGAYRWTQSYFSEEGTEEKHHLIVISAAVQPETRERVVPPEESPLPDIRDSGVTIQMLADRLGALSESVYGGQYKPTLLNGGELVGAENDDWVILLGESVMLDPTAAGDTLDSAVLQVKLVSLDGVAPNTLGATMLTYAAMTGLSEEEYMAFNIRLFEYPMWNDLAEMQPLAAKNGVMALLSDAENDGETVFLGWVCGY